jgi:hypothetical protein
MLGRQYFILFVHFILYLVLFYSNVPISDSGVAWFLTWLKIIIWMDLACFNGLVLKKINANLTD